MSAANESIGTSLKQTSPTIQRAFPHLTAEQVEEFGRELDAIRTRTIADLGERDAKYIRDLVKFQRRWEVGGRALLFAGILPPAWLAGTALLLRRHIGEAADGVSLVTVKNPFELKPALLLMLLTMALTVAGARNGQSAEFYRYLRSAEAQATLEKYGFQVR